MEERTPLMRYQTIFFVYDHRKHREEDDPKDAVLYFYPPSVNVEEQIALVGGLIGLVNFCTEVLQQGTPSVLSLTTCKFAVLATGTFILMRHTEVVVHLKEKGNSLFGVLPPEGFILEECATRLFILSIMEQSEGLSAELNTPQDFLKEHLQFLCDTFCLYQGSFETVRQKAGSEGFVEKLNEICNSYFSFCESYGDPLSQAFHVIPYRELPKSQCTVFLEASHILQRAQHQPGVLAGVLFNKNKVLCTQLSNSLTRRMLILMPQQQNFPCNEIKPEFDVPGGVRLLCVFLTTEELILLSPRRCQNTHARNDSAVDQTVPSDVAFPLRKITDHSSPQTNASVSVDLSDVFCDSVSDLPADESAITTSQADTIDHKSSLQNGQEKHSQNSCEDNSAKSQRSDTDQGGMNVDSQCLSEVKKHLLDSTLSEQLSCGLTDTALSNDPCLELHFDEDGLAKQSVAKGKVNSTMDENVASVFNDGSEMVESVLVSMETLTTECDGLTSKIQSHKNKDKSIDKDVSDTEESYKLSGHKVLNGVDNFADHSHPVIECDDTSIICDVRETVTELSADVVELCFTDGIKSGTDNQTQEVQSENPIHLTSTQENIQMVTGAENTKSDKTYSGASASCKADGYSDHENKGESRAEDRRDGLTAADDKDLSIEKITPEGDGASGSSFSADEDRDGMRVTSEAASSSELSSPSTGDHVTQVHFNTVPKVFGGQENNRRSSGQSPSELDGNSDLIKSGGSSVLSDEQMSPGKEQILFETTIQSTSHSSAMAVLPSSAHLPTTVQSTNCFSATAVLPSSGHPPTTVPSCDFGIDASSSDLAPSSESHFTAGRSSDSARQSQESLYTVEHKGSESETVDLDGRQPVLLYVQGHMDTLLILVLDSLARATKDNINKLWKSSLAKLAEMDFAVNDMDTNSSPEALRKSKASYLYLHYDLFSQQMKGTALQPVTSMANELVVSSVQMHDSFCKMPASQDIILRTHTTCSYGHKTLSGETFFQVASSGQTAAFPNARDPAFSIDHTADRRLYSDHNAALL